MLRHKGLVAPNSLVEVPEAFPSPGEPEDPTLGGERRRSLGIDRRITLNRCLEALAGLGGIHEDQSIAVGECRIPPARCRPNGRLACR